MAASKARVLFLGPLLVFQFEAPARSQSTLEISTEYASAKAEWNRCLARIKTSDLAVVDCNATTRAIYRNLADKTFAQAIVQQGSRKREALRRSRARWLREKVRHCYSGEENSFPGTLELMERSFCQVEEAEKQLTKLLRFGT